MRPDLTLVPKAPAAAQAPEHHAAPAAAPGAAHATLQQQAEMPFAVVEGQPITELPRDLYIPPQALEVFLEAQQKGKVRYIGFTGHATPQSHLRMLEHMKEKGDPLQTCQMPINVADPSFNSFILQVLPALVQRGYGVCAMKTLAGSGFTNRGAVRVVPNLISVEECLQFVWSLPVSTLISGPDNAEQFAQTISYAKRFKALDDEARKGLIAKVAGVAGRGVEYYKV